MKTMHNLPITTLSQWIKRMESEFQLEFGALVFQSNSEIMLKMIQHVVTWPVLMSLVHGVSTVTKHGKWSYKSQKGTGHVFYMATSSHATESAGILLS